MWTNNVNKIMSVGGPFENHQQSMREHTDILQKNKKKNWYQFHVHETQE
jgi:hypothetical protein